MSISPFGIPDPPADADPRSPASATMQHRALLHVLDQALRHGGCGAAGRACGGCTACRQSFSV